MLSELLLAFCKVCLSSLTRRRRQRLELAFDLSIISQSCSSSLCSSTSSSSSSSSSSLALLALELLAVVVAFAVVVIAVEVFALVARSRRQRQPPRRRHRTRVCCCSVCVCCFCCCCCCCCDGGGGSDGGVDDGGGCVRFGIAHCACGSHCNSRTIDGSLFAPSMNSSRLSLPSLLRSIWRKILSVRFSGVLSSSGIFITEPTIL